MHFHTIINAAQTSEIQNITKNEPKRKKKHETLASLTWKELAKYFDTKQRTQQL